MVVRTEANFCTVLLEDGQTALIHLTRALKAGPRVSTTLVAIGDRVRVTLEADRDSRGKVERVLPRRNQLHRLAPGRASMTDVLAANLDSLVIVEALHMPEFNAARLDRFLAIAEQAEIPASIVLNKADLAPPGEAEPLAETYRRAGYPVVVASAMTNQGIQDVRAQIRGITALIGPSGVGKSTMLNTISPGLGLMTGEVSEATGKGKHTTIVAQLLPVAEGDFVADTPGIRSIGLTDLDRYEVASLFKELQPLIGRCRFADCLHLEEPGCAVHAAVKQGRFAEARYQSYRRILEDVTEGYRQDWEIGR